LGLTAAILLIATGSAHGAVTVGQLGPGGSGAACGSDFDFLQPTVTSGNSYVMPYDGTITSWATRASSTAGAQLTLKVFRGTGGADYQVVGHAGPQVLQPNALDTFPANIAVKAGDVLGTAVPESELPACLFPVPGDSYLYRYGFPVPGGLADGSSGTFTSFNDRRLNVTAVLEPANTFTFGRVRRHRKKGTANVSLTLPNPGRVTVSGNGVGGSAVKAGAGITVPAAGSVAIALRAKGRKRRTLNETGAVKIKAIVTFIPAAGSPSKHALKLKLLKQ
jgi:hypothetical protein